MLNILHCAGQSPTIESELPLMSMLLRLRNLVLDGKLLEAGTMSYLSLHLCYLARCLVHNRHVIIASLTSKSMHEGPK